MTLLLPLWASSDPSRRVVLPSLGLTSNILSNPGRRHGSRSGTDSSTLASALGAPRCLQQWQQWGGSTTVIGLFMLIGSMVILGSGIGTSFGISRTVIGPLILIAPWRSSVVASAPPFGVSRVHVVMALTMHHITHWRPALWCGSWRQTWQRGELDLWHSWNSSVNDGRPRPLAHIHLLPMIASSLQHAPPAVLTLFVGGLLHEALGRSLTGRAFTCIVYGMP